MVDETENADMGSAETLLGSFESRMPKERIMENYVIHAGGIACYIPLFLSVAIVPVDKTVYKIEQATLFQESSCNEG